MTSFITSCAQCGADYEARNSRSRFCSDAHRAAGLRAEAAVSTRRAELVAALLRQRDRLLVEQAERDAERMLAAA